jgi:hypothetical protein
MRFRSFAVSVLVGALAAFALTAGEPAREKKVDWIDLKARCQKMLALQDGVYQQTLRLHKAIEMIEDKKPRAKEKWAALKLAGAEKALVAEAVQATKALEDASVAFPEVFRQLQQDMVNVERRLQRCDAGVVTRAIQKDIIDTLQEMIDALKERKNGGT